MGVVVEVRQGSVTDADVDVLVNASNTLGQLGTGVSAAIRASCGPRFQEIISTAVAARGGSMEPGDVLVTHAGKHPRARHVAHVAVMDYRPGALQQAPDTARIRRGSEELWRALERFPHALSVGMVALGAGTGGLGERLPTEIACDTLRAHLLAHPASRIARVVFHGFQLVEYMNVLDVVSRVWPEVLVGASAEVQAQLEALRRG